MDNDRSRDDPTPAPPTPPPALEPAAIHEILEQVGDELRRPLGALGHGLRSLAGRAPCEARRESLAGLAGLCEGLIRLTDGYIDYDRLAQELRPLARVEVRLSTIVSEADQIHRSVAVDRGLLWECRLDGEDHVVSTDRTRVQDILGHLVGNAFRYTPPGGHVRVLVRREGASWLLIVADNGPGIPPDLASRVLEPFVRLARDERTDTEANGLGLSICRLLVEQLGGAISVGPHPGQGTLATARMPIDAKGLSVRPHRPKRPDGDATGAGPTPP